MVSYSLKLKPYAAHLKQLREYRVGWNPEILSKSFNDTFFKSTN